MVLTGRDEERPARAGVDRAAAGGEGAAAAQHDVDLVFGVRLLVVHRADRDRIGAHAERRYPQLLHVPGGAVRRRKEPPCVNDLHGAIVPASCQARAGSLAAAGSAGPALSSPAAPCPAELASVAAAGSPGPASPAAACAATAGPAGAAVSGAAVSAVKPRMARSSRPDST